MLEPEPTAALIIKRFIFILFLNAGQIRLEEHFKKHRDISQYKLPYAPFSSEKENQ